MIVLKTPKGWTCPSEIDGKKSRGLLARRTRCPWVTWHKPEHITLLEHWMKSYRPEELFDDAGRLVPEIAGTGAEGATGA